VTQGERLLFTLLICALSCRDNCVLVEVGLELVKLISFCAVIHSGSTVIEEKRSVVHLISHRMLWRSLVLATYR